MTVDDQELSANARRLAAALEPFAGQVYFAPECHAQYVALGFSASPAMRNGIAMPDGSAYFCSRGSMLGQVPGELVAAAFAVFNPAAVIPAVTSGWSLTDATAIGQARTEGSVGQLTRILGSAPAGIARLRDALGRASTSLPVAGRPLYAGALAQEVPASPIGAAWRFADRLREYRGDSHTAAWTAAGLDAVEIGLMTELYWGLPLKTYTRSRAWSRDDLDDGIQRLENRGMIKDGALTAQGRDEREAIEKSTDRQCRPIIEFLGDEFDTVINVLTPLGQEIRNKHGYPASGPHDIARTTASQS
jgi:hypothetical protein